jgi:hypothetical protein
MEEIYLTEIFNQGILKHYKVLLILENKKKYIN